MSPTPTAAVDRTNPLAARVVLVLLLAYPLLTQFAVQMRSMPLAAAAAMLLLLALLRGPLLAGRGWAIAVFAAAAALLGWMSLVAGRNDVLYALYAVPVLIYGLLGWWFGRTLLRGREPLITRMAAVLDGEPTVDEPDLHLYTRQLTAVWVALFLLLAATNALLALLATPDGVLELLGRRSPWPVPAAAWSLFANFCSIALVLLLFVAEFSYRKRRFPHRHARYRNLLDFLMQARRALPGFAAAKSNAAPGAVDDVPRLVRRPSRRRALLVLLLVAHVGGIGLLALGAWPFALLLIVGSHLLVLWGTLAPGSNLLGAVVRRFHTTRRDVWITIDDGPSADTCRMLDLLDAHDARATFFLVAERAAADPEAVRRIVARGHDVGNHTLGHPTAWFWAAGPRAIRRQIGGAQQILVELSGRAPRLFRAAVGMANAFVAPELERHGLLRIAWSARAFDSRCSDPATVWRRLERDLAPGAVLLLHEGAAHGASVETLAYVLEQLDRLGYRCVLPDDGEPRPATTSQLLNGVPPHSGVKRGSSPA
jgi:peptidoglycan-N-acetylglucosamine deacetylase